MGYKSFVLLYNGKEWYKSKISSKGRLMCMNDIASVIVKPSLEESFLEGWKRNRIIFFSAPCGFGKTTMAKTLLSKHSVFEINARDKDFLMEKIPSDCDVVLIDDLQYMLDYEIQKELCDFMISHVDLHFVLLSRGNIPGWLMPFQFAGILFTVESSSLMFDRPTSQRMLESRGIELSHGEINEIHRITNGYPAAMDILSRNIIEKGIYNSEVLNKGRCDLFFYFEEAVYLRLNSSIRSLLISLAPFKSFSLELAKIVSGEPRAAELLAIVQRDSTMMNFDGVDRYEFWPFFKQFLVWEMHQNMSDREQSMLYSRAGLYYELQDDLKEALENYSLAGEESKVSSLLVKNANQHPGVGYYRDMKKYYFSLSREEILKSPSLISGMSMLTSLCMDYDASEEWYRELLNYASNLKKSDFNYRELQSKISYLDIALPQKGK